MFSYFCVKIINNNVQTISPHRFKKQSAFARLASRICCFGNSDYEYHVFFPNQHGVYEPHNWCWLGRLQPIFSWLQLHFCRYSIYVYFLNAVWSWCGFIHTKNRSKRRTSCCIALQKNVLAFALWSNPRLFYLDRRYISRLFHLWKFGLLF